MNMVLGRIYLILICLISTSFLGRADEEAILLDRLLADYNNLSRPVRNKSDIVHVFIEMAVVKVIDLDVVQKFIVINALVKQTWMDWRLTWDPSKNSGIEYLVVPSEKLWLPQVYVRNTMDTLEQPRVPRYFRLQSDGNLTSTAINQLKSHCHIDLEYFPFDRQICYPDCRRRCTTATRFACTSYT
ncbi:acetylcholine receptor subunit alpha-like [Ptychodera flava]|uniref:acetylcholine receptor subunit alpha-like n=1 Tax=Ptychodera flava TaxID=63121 RepID=UPI00396AAD84